LETEMDDLQKRLKTKWWEAVGKNFTLAVELFILIVGFTQRRHCVSHYLIIFSR
jgi:hypothetical protein